MKTQKALQVNVHGANSAPAWMMAIPIAISHLVPVFGVTSMAEAVGATSIALGSSWVTCKEVVNMIILYWLQPTTSSIFFEDINPGGFA